MLSNVKDRIYVKIINFIRYFKLENLWSKHIINKECN